MSSVIYNCAKNLITKSKCLIKEKKFNLRLRSNFCTKIGQGQGQGQGKKISLGNTVINYIKVGNGKKPLLCFPGALGTIWSDFKPQVLELDREQFTIVAFDPPGYGHSRPPNREFTLDFYERDATVAFELMKELKLLKFSLLGWSDGGISSLILAAKYPEFVDKLIVWGANSYILPEDIEQYEKIRNTKNWSDKAKCPLIKLYGEDGLQGMWSGWCDAMVSMQKRNGGNICMESVSKIKCPTLILHGAQDPVVLSEHPNYLNANIRDSRMHIFPKGKHNIHLRYPQEFNTVVTNFLLD